MYKLATKSSAQKLDGKLSSSRDGKGSSKDGKGSSRDGKSGGGPECQDVYQRPPVKGRSYL